MKKVKSKCLFFSLLLISSIFLFNNSIALNPSVLVLNTSTEQGIKGIVVGIPNYAYESMGVGSEITETVALHGGRIGWSSPKYSHFYVDVPQKNYSFVVDNLRNMGYKVRDEFVYRIHLDESVPAVGAPYLFINPEGNDQELTGVNRRIGVIDTGIDPNHPDFSGKIYSWRDSVEIVENSNYTSCCYDYAGHGTLVASVAAGTGQASSGKFRGMAPDAKLVVARGCNNWISFVGGEPFMNIECKERYVEDAITWMIDEGVDAITMSFGTGVNNYTFCDDMTMGVNQAIADAASAGITLVSSSGNEGPLYDLIQLGDGGRSYTGIVGHPACVDEVIAVGATYKKDYTSFESDTDAQEKFLLSTRIHVIVEVNGIVEKEYEWEAYNAEIIDAYFKSGFDISITPSSWPANVKIKFEGMERTYRVHPIYGISWDESWWPGDPESKGDDFWEHTYVFDSGEQIVVQFSAWPQVDYIQGELGWEYYHNFFYVPEFEEMGWEYINIFHCVLNTNQHLSDVVPFWSNRGHVSGDHYSEVVAPGYLVCAANSSQTGECQEDNPCGNDQYISVRGTSFSAPHVSGLVALLKEANPEASRSEIENAILGTAEIPDRTREGSLCNPYYSMGNGRINATRAAENIGACYGFTGSLTLTPDSVCESGTVTAQITAPDCHFVIAQVRRDSDNALMCTARVYNGNAECDFNAAGQVGTQSYTVYAEGISIGQDTITIYSNEKPYVELVPPSQTGLIGQTLDYTFSVRNNDDAVCGASPFTLIAQCPTEPWGWICELDVYELILDPGQTGSTTMHVTSPSTASSKEDGGYRVTAWTYNSNVGYEINNATFAYYFAFECLGDLDCTSQPAEDSDGGQDPTIQGTCTDYSICSDYECVSDSYTDYCFSGCTGIPNSCQSYGDQTSCTDSGCTWNPSQCKLDVDMHCCGDEISCYLSDWLAVSCQSIGLINCPGYCNDDCGTYTSQSDCEYKYYCDWNQGGCEGTPSPCSSYGDQTSCTNVGCTWNPEALMEYYVPVGDPTVCDSIVMTCGNCCSGGECIVLEGDVNHDNSINILDLVIVGNAFGSTLGDPDWDERADIKEDGVINIFDLSIVGKYYGDGC